MTKEEFIEKYGDVKVKFSNYYKFTFTYTGELPDGKIVVYYGGNSDDIYRFSVSADSLEAIVDLDPSWGSVYRDGVQVESFCEY